VTIWGQVKHLSI